MLAASLCTASWAQAKTDKPKDGTVCYRNVKTGQNCCTQKDSSVILCSGPRIDLASTAPAKTVKTAAEEKTEERSEQIRVMFAQLSFDGKL